MRTTSSKPWVVLAAALTAAGALTLGRCPPERQELSPIAEPVPPAPEEPLHETQTIRIVAKELIAREVAAGQRPLLEAAALFGALNRLPPASPSLERSDAYHRPWGLPARTEEERLCRQVADWVGMLLRYEAPDRMEATVARLEAECRAELARRGTIRLPEASSLESVEGLLRRACATLTEQQRQALLRVPE